MYLGEAFGTNHLLPVAQRMTAYITSKWDSDPKLFPSLRGPAALQLRQVCSITALLYDAAAEARGQLRLLHLRLGSPNKALQTEMDYPQRDVNMQQIKTLNELTTAVKLTSVHTDAPIRRVAA